MWRDRYIHGAYVNSRSVIYIYIYVCVCACNCVCLKRQIDIDLLFGHEPTACTCSTNQPTTAATTTNAEQQVIMQQQGMYPQQQQMIMQQQGMYPQQQQIQVMPMNGVMVIQPNIMTNIQPPFPNEGDWVAKYGGSTFQCCDDPTCCCYSMFCLPCANGQACAWGNAINGNGDVAAQICANIVIDFCCDFICHSCMAANAQSL